MAFAATRIFNDLFYLGTLAFFAASWIILLVGVAYGQSQIEVDIDFSDSGFSNSRIFSFVWWTLFFQLFAGSVLIYNQIAKVFDRSLPLYLILISLFQTINVTDSYIFITEYHYLTVIGVGALLLSITNFVWLFYFSIIPKEGKQPLVDEEKQVFEPETSGAEIPTVAPVQSHAGAPVAV